MSDLININNQAAENIYLSGNPQITYFKIVFRRHTNFAIETKNIDATKTLSIDTFSKSATFEISSGSSPADLLSKLYVETSANSLGHGPITKGDKLIKKASISIGGQKMDEQTGEWLQIWSELNIPKSKADGFRQLTSSYLNGHGTSSTDGKVQIPLRFWFCNNFGLALPLISLQNTDVKVRIDTNPKDDCMSSEASTYPILNLRGDYIHLDTDEKRRFATASHEYIIEQIQHQTFQSSSVISGKATNVNLGFTKSVKEIIWTDTGNLSYSEFNITGTSGNPIRTARPPEYFRLYQPLNYHTSIPGYNVSKHDHTNLLSTPLVAGPYQLQALSGNDTENIATALGDDHACMAILGSLTADAAKTESGNGVKTLVIREATADQTFKVADLIQLRINAVDEDTTDVSSVQTFKVTAVRTATIGGKSYTELTLDRNPLTNALATGAALTITDGDDLLISIIARSHHGGRPNCSSLEKKINVYSFALKPEEQQPSGVCNFTKTGRTVFNLMHSESGTFGLNVYAISYNILRIMSGSAGLGYA